LAKWLLRRQQNGAAHTRAEIDERAALERKGHVAEESSEIADGRRFVMRRVDDVGPDRFGVKFAEKDQRFGRHVVLGIEALSRTPARDADCRSHAGRVRRRQSNDMPEGPQVARYARLHGEKLCGTVVHADSPNARSSEVAALIDGATLRRVEAVGKHLLYDFGEDRLLHVHLGRFGNFRQGSMPLPEVRGIVRFRMYTETDWFELRGAIAIEIYDAAMRGLLEDRIGPNPLDPAAQPKRAYDRIVASRTAIGLQMMDQSIVAGIGNIYRSEVLFLNGVNPLDPGSTLERKTWRAIWKDLARVMAHGADVGRIVTTWPKDRKKAIGPVRAEDRLYVYHRTALPCRRCGTLVESAELGKRSIFWCPQCQPARPAPEVDATAPTRTRRRNATATARQATKPRAAQRIAKKTAAKRVDTTAIRSRQPDDETTPRLRPS